MEISVALVVCTLSSKRGVLVRGAGVLEERVPTREKRDRHRRRTRLLRKPSNCYQSERLGESGQVFGMDEYRPIGITIAS